MAFASSRSINVLFISAEANPFTKIGGLGDYSGSLPTAIANIKNGYHKNVDIRVALPFHKAVEKFVHNPKKIAEVNIPTHRGSAVGAVYEYNHQQITYYLIKRSGNPSGYNQIYNPTQIADARKFIFFSLASLAFLEDINWKPHILHANDWHTALAVHKLSELREIDSFFHEIKSILVIHNMPFLGEGSQKILKQFDISPTKSDYLPEWAQSLPLPIGLLAADMMVTVSPSYAEELKTEEFGDGLAKFFKTNSTRLAGIINGIDTNKWDPNDDPFIFSKFKRSNLASRKANKYDLLSSLGLEDRMSFPLFVMISRLTHQKGIDIILQSIPRLINQDWTAIFLGSGNPTYEVGLKKLEAAISDRVRVILDYNASFAHTMYAGGDIFLMPSLYEPCGISQMIAMRYGCIPVARAVGGLKDTITHTPDSQKTGYLFKEASDAAFINCLLTAMLDFSNKEKWEKIQMKAMGQDFSWKHSANLYLDLYRQLIDL